MTSSAWSERPVEHKCAGKPARAFGTQTRRKTLRQRAFKERRCIVIAAVGKGQCAADGENDAAFSFGATFQERKGTLYGGTVPGFQEI